MNVILTQSQLKRINEHKYSVTGTSIIEPYFQPYWKWLVEQIPLTWAPNTITSIGLALNVITTLILVIFSPDGKQEAPRWVYFICAVGLFVYQSLDAIDGKQARRTKTNTPLGELFDHGCDSVSTVFVAVGTCVALRLGQDPEWMMFEVFNAIFLFYMAHWQTYVTGTLRFSLFDVTESQVGVIIIYVMTAFIGPSIWDLKIPVLGMPVRIFLVFVSLGPTFLQLQANLSVIRLGGIGRNKSTVADTSTIFPVFPIGLVLVLGIMIAYKSPSSLFMNHPCLYLLSFGIVAAKVINRLVVAHMSKSELNLVDLSIIGPAMLFLNQYFNCFINEYLLLWICFIYVVQDMLVYSYYVCNEICDFLGIYCFDITTPHPKKNTKNN